MPTVHSLVIVLRKTVPDEATGQTLLDLVKSRFEDQPDIDVTGQMSTKFDVQE